MKFEFIYDPVPLIIIRDLFTKKESEEILAEAIKNKNNFKPSQITKSGMPLETNLKFRSNTVAYYDVLYESDRSKCKLLTLIDKNFNNRTFRDVLESSQYPINLFSMTNSHETQVSRYGDQGQRYNYHIDSEGVRLITLVYYFNKDPKKYKGGEIQFTRSPISAGNILDKNAIPITITPENNMMVIFDSRIAHTVLPTTSPKNFDGGRFSANVWLGRK
jgi:Rps23 Pro-64 3,4-dihydroxylase Tpa1-like proline 4-hydroxylase